MNKCLLFLLFASAILSGCADGTVPVDADTNTSEMARALPDVADRTILFGHQSVGANILEGIRDLNDLRGSDVVRIQTLNDDQGQSGPAIVQMRIGTNGDPASKLRDFTSALERGVGESVQVALMKFCYLDFGPETDVPEVFEMYRREIARVAARYPGLRLAHVTVPLTTSESLPRHWAKKLLRRPTGADLNEKRNQFNELLRSAYGPAVFDLARLEATRPDGTRAMAGKRSDSTDVLAREWASDAGHLNAAGRRMMATQFLGFLSRL